MSWIHEWESKSAGLLKGGDEIEFRLTSSKQTIDIAALHRSCTFCVADYCISLYGDANLAGVGGTAVLQVSSGFILVVCLFDGPTQIVEERNQTLTLQTNFTTCKFKFTCAVLVHQMFHLYFTFKYALCPAYLSTLFGSAVGFGPRSLLVYSVNLQYCMYRLHAISFLCVLVLSTILYTTYSYIQILLSFIRQQNKYCTCTLHYQKQIACNKNNFF